MLRFRLLFLSTTRRAATTLGLGLALLLASRSGAAALDLATGLHGATGIAFDEVHQHLYFVEFGSGTLKRLVLTPVCDNPAAAPTSCAIETVTTGLGDPEDVAVDGASGFAYVTTRTAPFGTTGALYQIDLNAGLPAPASLVTFNLGAPHQIVLDPPTHSAWVTGFTSGKVWRIDLTTGAKAAVVSGLRSPVGLAVSADRANAYVSEQGGTGLPPERVRVAEFDLATGSRIRDLVTGASAVPAGGLQAPFFLRWTDASGGALYVVERDPANRASRIDLVAGETRVAIPTLPFRPSGFAVNHPSGAAYVTTDTSVVRVELVTVPPSQPVFLNVGWIPSTDVDANGYSTNAGFLHSPFGGTLDLFGNLSKFWGWGARAYSVEVSDDGGASFAPVRAAWTVARYNLATNKYEAQTVAPDAAGRYAIPANYDPTHYTGYLWSPSALALRWPSSADGLHQFRFRLFDAAGGAVVIPANETNLLALYVDNSPLKVDLEAVVQVVPPNRDIAPCEIVAGPSPNAFRFRITARDPNQHLRSYRLYALWGKNGTDPNIASDSYSPSHENEEGPYAWSGVPHALVPAVPWRATCNCAHTFLLEALKRTTNGYVYIWSDVSHQSITINNVSAPSCPL